MAKEPIESTDILVVGGSPAGVAAALAAARQGHHVTLIEKRPYLGTVMTAAMLNVFDLDRWQGEYSTIHGIFDEFYGYLGQTFDPFRARQFLLQKIRSQPLITLHLKTEFVKTIVKEKQIQRVLVRRDGSIHEIEAKLIIDATDDADVAAAAGVPYSIGRQGSGIDSAMQPATLMFRLKNIQWMWVYLYLQFHDKPHKGGFVYNYFWGYPSVVKHYRPSDPDMEALDLNLGRMIDRSAWTNAIQIFEVDGTNPQSVQNAYQRVKQELPDFVAFLRANALGFKNAELLDVAPELYIRETRHIFGLYRLTAADILREKMFRDRIAVASYPIDLHPYHRGEVNPFRAARHVYTIPIRCIIPQKIDNLFVASRSFSATYEAAGSARIVPTTIALGEAAGIAAHVCLEAHATPRYLARDPALVKNVQNLLRHEHAQLEY